MHEHGQDMGAVAVVVAMVVAVALGSVLDHSILLQ